MEQTGLWWGFSILFWLAGEQLTSEGKSSVLPPCLLEVSSEMDINSYQSEEP